MHSKLYLCETCPFQTKYYHNLISHIWKTYILFISNTIVEGISNSKMEAFGHKIEIEKSQLITITIDATEQHQKWLGSTSTQY